MLKNVQSWINEMHISIQVHGMYEIRTYVEVEPTQGEEIIIEECTHFQWDVGIPNTR
jgi:hypothetical protein